MSHLYLPWGSGSSRYSNNSQVRNQFASSLDLHDTNYEYQQNSPQRQRSPSLPPIRNSEQSLPKDDSRRTLNRNLSSTKRFSFYDEDAEGDTSGYGSETVNISRRNGIIHESNPVVAWQQKTNDNGIKNLNEDMPSNDGRRSARSPRITSEEGRPRWGDRGVATGRLWEPTAPNARLPQMPNQKKGTPAWVERGLNMIDNSAEILVIDQQSSYTSGLDFDRSSCNGSDEGRTYLRGQNIHLEPEVKAQRENKRIKALELQSAILNQLEDQEKRRQEERERKLKEEKLEELRIQREQEEDRLKYEEEKRKMEERQLMEQRKLETLKKALEVAEIKAKQEKEKRFTKHKNNVKNNVVAEKPLSSRCETLLNTHDANTDKEKINELTVKNNDSPTKSNRTYDVHSAKSQTIPINNNTSRQNTEFNSPRSIGTGNLNFYLQNMPPIPLQENQLVPLGINSDIMNNQQNGLQLAVLVPQNLTNMYSLSLNSLNTAAEYRDNSARVLTPRKFRNSNYKDASTQTDSTFLKYTIDRANETEDNVRSATNDYQNIDENAPQESHHNALKKERRLRSEERFKKDIENRPKWGVNRPAAQYKKQSEKDPFYSQKRKIRQKHRPQPRQYLSQSSDDSRSPSPPMRIEKNDGKQRNSVTQSYWRNKRSNQDLLRPNDDFVDDILIQPVYNQMGQVTINDITEKKSPVINKSSPSKRMTLSQKFINDKYGNRKLWNDDVVTDRSVKSLSLDVENRKKIIEQLNIAKREYLEKFEDQDTVSKTKL